MNNRDLKEELENLEKWIEDIQEEEGPIIVEGFNDTKALRNLGIEGEIIHLNRGDSIVVFCEKLRGRSSAIILTDWDRKGGHLARIISDGLQANGVKYDLEYRARLAVICHKETKDVEGIYAHYLRLKDRLGV